MAEGREEPYYDKIKHGRMRAWIYLTGRGGKPGYDVECFRFDRRSARSKWRKNHRYNHARDFPDLARCLEEADRWIAKQEGRDAPESREIDFPLPEVAAILHLLGSVRGLDTDSPALWEFEKRIRSSLGEVAAQQIQDAVSEHEKSELYEHIEAIRKKLIPPQKAS